jgi:hypothetical protein
MEKEHTTSGRFRVVVIQQRTPETPREYYILLYLTDWVPRLGSRRSPVRGSHRANDARRSV